MRNRLNSMRTASSRRNAAQVIDALAEDLRYALDTSDIVPIEEGGDYTTGDGCDDCDDTASLFAEADAFLAGISDEAEVPGDNKLIISETNDIINACDMLESRIAKIEQKEKDEEEEKKNAKEASEILASCDEVERKIVAAERRASTVGKGIEDRIGDQAHGISDVVLGLRSGRPEGLGTRKGVFGTNSRSQYVASITKRLDRVADILEKQGKKRMAFRIDRLADAIENQADI